MEETRKFRIYRHPFTVVLPINIGALMVTIVGAEKHIPFLMFGGAVIPFLGMIVISVEYYYEYKTEKLRQKKVYQIGK